jgi:hypothetical protein
MMSSPVDERPMRGAKAVGRIKLECLRCGHSGALAECELPRYGIKPDAAIATFIKRLTCRACGGQSVRAFRSDQ